MPISSSTEQRVRFHAIKQAGEHSQQQLEFTDALLLQELCGPIGQHLKVLEQNLGVRLVQNGIHCCCVALKLRLGLHNGFCLSCSR